MQLRMYLLLHCRTSSEAIVLEALTTREDYERKEIEVQNKREDIEKQLELVSKEITTLTTASKKLKKGLEVGDINMLITFFF